MARTDGWRSAAGAAAGTFEPDVRKIELSDAEQGDLLAFMREGLRDATMPLEGHKTK